MGAFAKRLGSTRHGTTLRLTLAIVLVLAGLATARLQGAASGAQALGLAATALCSGGVPPEGGQPQAHVHCVLCSFTFADTPARNALAAPVAQIVQRMARLAERSVEAGAHRPYQSQGPPHRA